MPRFMMALTMVLLLGAVRSAAQEPWTRFVVLDREVWGTPTWPVPGFRTPLSAVQGPGGEYAYRGLMAEEQGGAVPRLQHLEALLGVMLGWDVVEQLEFEDLYPLLQLRGPPDAVKAARSAIARLEDAMPRYRVQAVRLAPSAWKEIPRALITTDLLSELRNKHEVKEDLTGYARSEGGVRLAAARWRSMVHDLDVEASGGSVVADPRVGVVPLGSELVVRPWALEADHVLVRVDGRHGTLIEEPRRRECGGAMVLDQNGRNASGSVGAVQSPRASVSSFSGTGWLGPDHALVVGDRTDASGPWILTLKASDSQAAWTEEKVQVVHTAPLTVPWSPPESLPHLMSPSGVAGGYVDVFASAGGIREPRVLKAPFPEFELRSALRLEGAEDTTFAQFGSLLLVRGEKGELDKVAADFSILRHQLVQSYQLELRWGELPGQPALDGLTPQDLSHRLEQGGLLVGRRGDHLHLFTGEESHFLKDHDVEISQASSGADPIVDVAWTGFAFVGAIERLRPVHVRLHGALLYQVPVQELKPFELGGPQGGSLDQLDLAHTRAASHWDLPLDEWTLLQRATLEGTGRQFVCLARVRLQ